MYGSEKVNLFKITDQPPTLGIQVSEKQNVSSFLTRIDANLWGACITERRAGPQIVRPEFRILCLEGSVISCISPSSGDSPGPV